MKKILVIGGLLVVAVVMSFVFHAPTWACILAGGIYGAITADTLLS